MDVRPLPFSMFLDPSLVTWWKVMKIMLMTFVCVMLVKSARNIHRLAWVLAISLGFYGVKVGMLVATRALVERRLAGAPP